LKTLAQNGNVSLCDANGVRLAAGLRQIRRPVFTAQRACLARRQSAIKIRPAAIRLGFARPLSTSFLVSDGDDLVRQPAAS
jgi:hypothetical protein